MFYTNTSAPSRGLATAEQAAAFLAVHRCTLWRLERRGLLHPIRIGRSVRFSWGELEVLASSGDGAKQ